MSKRITALLLAVVVVVGSTLISGAGRLRRDCRALEETFFTSDTGKAPVYYIDRIISASASLANMGDNYAVLSAAGRELRDARIELVRAEDRRSISQMFDACAAVSRAAEAFTLAAAELDMNAYDRDLIDTNHAAVAGALREILEGGYNESVREYVADVYSRFPASAYALLFGIEAPEEFA